MQLKKYFSLSIIFGLLLYLVPSVQAQVSIGSGLPPHEGTLLDLKEAITTSKGLGMPRVQLLSLTIGSAANGNLATTIAGASLSPVWDKNAHIGLTVYNLTEDLYAVEPIAPGIYVWDGAKWDALRPVIAGDPAILPAGNGTFTGRTLFDLALTDHDSTEANKTRGAKVQRATEYHYANFSTTNSYTYTFTPSATVSNVRFVYVRGNGVVVKSITGNYLGATSSAVVATVTYDTQLQTTAKGTIVNGTGAVAPLTANIYVVYNNGTEDVQQKLTVIVQDGSFCGAYMGANQTLWKTFQCHNAGADYTKDPLVASKEIAGNYYKWSNPNPVATAETSPLISASWTPSVDWGTLYAPLVPSAATPWPANTTPLNSQPCPSGYRVPTKSEWALITSGHDAYNGAGAYNIVTKQGASGAALMEANFTVGSQFGDNLFLPAGGYRNLSNGVLSSRGLNGYYWSSTENGTNASSLYLKSGGATTSSSTRTNGFFVRCISEF